MFAQPFPSIDECVRLNGRARPQHPAFICGSESVSWCEFNKRVNRLANTILGLTPAGDARVAFLCDNSIVAVEILFAIFRAGRTAVPLSGMLTSAQIETMLRDSGASICIVDEANRNHAGGVQDAFEGSNGHVPVALDFQSEGWLELPALIEAANRGDPQIFRDAEHACNIIYSSGTTGTPKGIVHSYGARMFFSLTLGQTFQIGRDSVSLVSTPLYTNGTWLTLMPTAIVGGTTVLLPKFDPEMYLTAASKNGATHAFMVPTQFRALIDFLENTNMPPHRFQLMITAGSAMPATLWRDAERHFGPCLSELYGLTEGIGTFKTVTEAQREVARQSVGRPLPGMDIRIIAENGSELPAGQEGEIVGRSAALMQGYHNRPEANQETLWADVAGQRFIRTGDVGLIDDDGYLFLRGRKKDMITSGGLNVFLPDLEEALRGCDGIGDAAVVGIPDVKWGEAAFAFVIPASDTAPDAEAVLRSCNSGLARHQKISRLVIWKEDFPRNALGKVLKNELLKMVPADQTNNAGEPI